VRLLFVTDRLSDRGGADLHLAQVISDVIGFGYRVTVAYGRDEGGIAFPSEVRRLRVPGLSRQVASGARLGALDALLDEADVIHVQNVMNPVALARATDRHRTVVTVQDHRVFCPGGGKTLPDGSACSVVMADGDCEACLSDGDYRRRTLELTRQRLAALKTAQVVVLSRYMAVELEAAGIAKVRVIPPWIKLGERRAKPGDTVMLGGRLVKHKGVNLGWRAWNAAGRPLPMAVAGSGPLESELEGVDLLGWLSPGDLVTALRRARLLLFPAWWQEPFGILGLEALAQGTPVVVADAGGISEWARDGCIRVAPGDVEAMATAVGELAADPGAALALGRAGQTAVGLKFVRERIVAELEGLYRGFLDS